MGKSEKEMISFNRGAEIVRLNEVINYALDFGSVLLVIIEDIVIIIKADTRSITEKAKHGIAAIR